MKTQLSNLYSEFLKTNNLPEYNFEYMLKKSKKLNLDSKQIQFLKLYTQMFELIYLNNYNN